MKTNPHTSAAPHGRRLAYLLVEALVYISVLFVVLGVGYMAAYKFIDHSVALRHNADDITAALNAGELWRADIRASTNAVLSKSASGEGTLSLQGPAGTVEYVFADSIVWRRVGSRPWTRLLVNVNSSSMALEPRQNLTAWSWELELKPRVKTKGPPRVRPLFTFLAVPDSKAAL